MSDSTIKISLTSNAADIALKLERFPDQMSKAAAGAMDKANQDTLGIAERERLAFPYPGPTTLEGLRTISGDLKRAGRAEKSIVSGNVVLSAIGNPVPYALVHEFGFSGTQEVRAHQRTIKVTRPSFDTLGRERSKKYKQTGLVSGHSRRVNFPARRMYTRSIEENTPNYTKGISEAITAAWGAQV